MRCASRSTSQSNTSNHEITNGFNITYRGRDPKSTQLVAGELAGKIHR